MNFNSKIVYLDVKEAFKALNANKIVQNEFNRTIESIRNNKKFEVTYARSRPESTQLIPQSEGSVNIKNFLSQNSARLRQTGLANPKLTSYKTMPKIRVTKSPDYNFKKGTTKMEAKELKAGIARYLLSKVSHRLTTNLPENPFSKIIRLPQMMGMDVSNLFGKFVAGAPMFFWRK